MSVLATPAGAMKTGTLSTARMPFLAQVLMMTRRAFQVTLRSPAEIIPGTLIGVFFLLIYEGSLGGAARFFLPGQSYLGFILPLSVITTALSGAAVAGQLIVRDSQSGYFDKLLLTPVSRAALLLGPMIAGAVVIMLQCVIILLVALVMGLNIVTGVAGMLLLLGFALLIGLAFSGLIVSIALWTNNAAAVGGASFLFFPLTFLTSAYTPAEQLTGWIATVAQFNPVTYLLEATRALINTGWEVDLVVRGLVICLLLCGVTFTMATFSLRSRTRRR